ncbi:hypothetical protein SAMN05216328_1553 [Ensifer sp. YR511]|nr:hypothetical protein SAMN05216328_1553 [Ensifer sp. YR511]
MFTSGSILPRNTKWFHLFRIPFDVGGCIENFTTVLRERLAHFGGQDSGQLISVGHYQVEPSSQDCGPRPGRRAAQAGWVE